MSQILALDPSGTSTTGIFLYESWSSYQISSFTSENWLKQAENLKELVKRAGVKIIVVETSRLWKKTRYNFHFDRLIKLVGYAEYLASELGVEYVAVDNWWKVWGQRQAQEGKIPGLVVQEVQGPRGRPKQVWTFKGQVLNEHEKDAVLIFAVYWIKFQQQEWPFSD